MKNARLVAALLPCRPIHIGWLARLAGVAAAGLLASAVSRAQLPTAPAAPTTATPARAAVSSTNPASIAPPKRLLDAEPAKPVNDAPAPAGAEQTIQRIRTEDAGSRIDELRVGGETQQITVQPKTTVPAYEVRPAQGARGNAPAAGSNETNGSRVWNVFKF